MTLPQQTKLGIRDAGAKALYWLVSVAVWLLVNVAVTAGVLAVLFIMFANASFEGFFLEVRNLADHYLGAPMAVRLDFEQLVAFSFAFNFAVVSLCRLSAFRLAGAQNDEEASHV